MYLVTSQEFRKDKHTLTVAEEAIRGGIDILQMREKGKSQGELVELGYKLLSLCSQNDVIFIVNDDPFLAKKVNADGVHLGQEDMIEYPVKKTRGILGKDKIIGVSTHSLEQFREANEDDCDYIAFGPLFTTKSKDYSIGTDNIEEVLTIAEKPVVFIGGINLTNIDVLLMKRVKNIAVIRAIVQADDITSRARDFKNKIKEFIQ